MKAPTLTFAGGILSKGLWGRVDLNKYQSGLKASTNFFIAVEGGVSKRWGMYYVGKPKFQDKVCKLWPWRIANDDSYILEFGDLYIRFIRFGGYVAIPGGHTPIAGNDAANVGGYMEITTTYTAAEARELKITFANDVAYITHVNHKPAQLKRLGLYDWDFADTDFAPNQAAPTGLTLKWEVQANNTNVWVDITGNTNPSVDGYEPIIDDIFYKVSATMSDGLETLASAAVAVNGDLGYARLRVKVTWTAVAGAKQYTIYKGKAGIYGYVGSVQSTDPLIFYDKNYAPSYDTVPVVLFPGFDLPATTGEWPRVSQFYKQRMAYAATKSQPQTIWFSQALFFSALTGSLPVQDTDSIKATIVGNYRNTINHIIQLKKFIVFTDEGEWVFGSNDGSALTGASFDPVQETAYGSDPFLSPKPIGDRILFVQAITGAIRDMGYEFATDAYKADDLSRLARDLFENKTIVSWDYAAFPNNMFSCVCNDGSVNQMAYVREHEIWGWSTLETLGIVTDTASVTEVNQNAEYFQTTRVINGVVTKFIERTEVSFTDVVEDMFYVDCGLTYEDKRAFTALTVLDTVDLSLNAGASHGRSIGDEIRVQTSQFDMKFLVTNVVGNVLTLITKFNKPLPPITVLTGSWWVSASSFTGFNHLANQSGLVALADGKVVRDLTCSAGGVITIPFKASKVHVGFPYEGLLETLDLDIQAAAGQYPIKAIDRIAVRLRNSRGIEVAASEVTEREYVRIPGRSTEDYDEANTPLDGIYDLPSHVAWARTGGVKIRSSDPLPANILNIIPDIIYGN